MTMIERRLKQLEDEVIHLRMRLEASMLPPLRVNTAPRVIV